MASVRRNLQVADWLRNQKETLESVGSSVSALAKQGTTKFGFKVTPGCVKTLLKACEINMPRRRNASASAAQVDELVRLARYLLDNIGDDLIEDIWLDLADDKDTLPASFVEALLSRRTGLDKTE